jgi:hypothetical protein
VGVTPTRATDSDAAGELSGGSTVYVAEGTRNKRRVFTIFNPAGSVTPGTTEHEWTQLQTRDFGLVEATPTTEAVKGDRCTYYADKTNGILWEFLYDGEGEFPWKMIGVIHLFAEVATEETTASVTYANLATTGPTVTAPLKGDYFIDYGLETWNTTVNANSVMSLAIGAAEAAAAESIVVLQSASITSIPGANMRRVKKTGVAAGTAFLAKYKVSTGTGTFRKRWVSLIPIRVA